ncbi:MAG: methyltransferase family protein [Parvularculaceae bacterium]
MGRIGALIGSTVFFFIAPGTVAGFGPWLITGWETDIAAGVSPLHIAGLALVLVGVAGLIDAFARFALDGLGTPAPIAAPKNLVTTGAYRFVRNPMYVWVLAAILGQALFFKDAALLFYAAGLWLAFHLFVVLVEEPALRRGFGADYERYCANVPRWLPRLRPWRSDKTAGEPRSV